MIKLLNRAVTKALKCEYFFDVYDELDAYEEKVEFQESVCEDTFLEDSSISEVKVEFHSSVCTPTFVEDPSVSNLARQYGNACNRFLRSAACSYQAVILHKDCTTGEPINTSGLSNTLPTKIQTSTSATVANTTEPTSATTKATNDSPTAIPTADTQKITSGQSTSAPTDCATGDAMCTTPDSNTKTG